MVMHARFSLLEDNAFSLRLRHFSSCVYNLKFEKLKLQLHNAIYRLRFYSNWLIHILSLSNSHNNVASLQKNRGDKSHCVIVALAILDLSSFSYVLEHVSKAVPF